MIVLDANVLISHWGTPEVHTQMAFEILDTAEELLLHPVTLAECLVGFARQGQEIAAIEEMARLGIDRHMAQEDEPMRVARLRAKTGLKLPDVYVLATAIELGATLATFDRGVADAARDRNLHVVGA